MLLKEPLLITILALMLSFTTHPDANDPPLRQERVVQDSIIPANDSTLPANDGIRTDAFLENLLKQYPQYFDSILQNRHALNVQLAYTRIDKGANGIPNLETSYFNLDTNRYFYPASVVKLPVSILALQKLNELGVPGLNRNTTMINDAGFSGQTPVYNDPTAWAGNPSIAQYIKKIMMVSDNDAFNRLYEFLGQQYINRQLTDKGYPEARILHRLSLPLSAEENRNTNPVRFFDHTYKLLYDQPLQTNAMIYPLANDSLGYAHYRDGQLVNEPMDFSGKNRISLEALHNILISLVFPVKVPGSQRFNLTPDDRAFLLKFMSQLPTESVYPPYSTDTAKYWPAYGKFLFFGAEKGDLPKNIRIFNKIGAAYGQLTDVAYFVDMENKIEFFLSATIYCNSNGILNDDQYDYDSIGLPFMKHLGQVIYDYELKRERKIIPTLEDVMFDYADGPGNPSNEIRRPSPGR